MAPGSPPRVAAGTSGYSYPAWRGSFYPQGLPTRGMLTFYGERFDTVEINNTFYRMPTAASLSAWAAQVPEAFRFALKAPQRITHQLRLRDAGEVTNTFCTLATGLGPKLGPLLFQLPPFARADLGRLRDFLAGLPPGLQPAFEFRHPSWLDDAVYTLLAEHGAALCIADSETLETPFVTTAPFGYLRLRRTDYADADLDTWASRVIDTGRWKQVYVYFKHEDSGCGPALARAFLERFGPRPKASAE
jgi:uncharacterized protein YecE (DUF72 family)